MARHLSGVVFRRKWQPAQLKPWEGPFADPQEPRVAAERAAARKRWRERQRAQEAATLAAERNDAVVCAQRWTAID